MKKAIAGIVLATAITAIIGTVGYQVSADMEYYTVSGSTVFPTFTDHSWINDSGFSVGQNVYRTGTTTKLGMGRIYYSDGLTDSVYGEFTSSDYNHWCKITTGIYTSNESARAYPGNASNTEYIQYSAGDTIGFTGYAEL